MKFAVSSYSFGQYTGSGRLTTFGCIEKAKEMGFDAIEFVEFNGPNGETPWNMPASSGRRRTGSESRYRILPWGRISSTAATGIWRQR